jgi:hypothetical protein
MSTLQNTPQHRDRIRTRLGTGILALSTLIAIGLALLILMPTGHRTTPPTRGSIATEAALAAQTPARAGCFRDPATHALTCSHPAPAPIVTPAPAGYLRDPATHTLLRIPAPRTRAGGPTPDHPRGRIIP